MKKQIILAALASGLVTIAAAEPLDTQTFTLTAIDVVPTKDEINKALMGSGLGTPDQQLEALAASGSDDTGVRLRAINALPDFYGSAGSSDPVDITLHHVIADNAAELTGANVVVLRAAIESLGELKVPEDVGTLYPLLNHPSRDIRAATARALGVLCNTAAINNLRMRYQNESTDQVKLAISETLRTLSQAGACQ